MKLYKEEQVIEAMRNIAINGFRGKLRNADDINDAIDWYINEATPIKLPSDEEIEKYVDSTPYCGHCTFEFKEGVEYGAKWVIEQIKQQNK